MDTLTTATLTRTNANKLALDLDAEGKQVFTLQNNVSDTKFLFGNPSMAYIDMYKFLSDNGLKATFYYNEDENWIGTTPTTTTTTPDRYLAPMRAVIIEAQTAATTLNVTLKRDHMTLRTQLDKGTDPTDEGHGDAPLAAPRRVDGVRTGYLRSDVMNIYAFNDDVDAFTRLCINNFADNAYIEDEDAPFIYSMNVDDAALSTPMNIYTVCGDMALSADARESITRVPLAFLIDDDYRTVDMKLNFTLSVDWPQNVWLYDAQTDVYSPIYNGIVYEIETPANHEIRYYIVGASEDNPTVPTALDEQPEEEDIAAATGSDWKLYVYNMHQSHATLFCDYLMTDIVAYDLAGRVIAHIAPNSTSATLQLPQGVALFEVTTPAGKRVVRTIIK